MSEPFYVARTEIERLRGVRRRASIATGAVFEFGVHGPIKRHYGLEAEPDLPLPVDYIVAATGG